MPWKTRLANWRFLVCDWCSTDVGSHREAMMQSASFQRRIRSWNAAGEVEDARITYPGDLTLQMLRYSGKLPLEAPGAP